MVGSNAVLVLQKCEETLSSTAAPRPNYGDRRRIKGRLDKMSTQEMESHDSLGEKATHRFMCRYFREVEVTTADRFRYGNRIFDITGITNRDNHSYEFVLKEK